MEQQAALVRSIQVGDVSTVMGSLHDVDAQLTSLGAMFKHISEYPLTFNPSLSILELSKLIAFECGEKM